MAQHPTVTPFASQESYSTQKHITKTLSMWKTFVTSVTHDQILAQWRLIPQEYAVNMFLHVPHDIQIELLVNMSANEQEFLLLHIAHADMHELLNDIAPDDLVDLFQQVNPDVRESVWSSLSPKMQEITTFLLRFDKDDAAGIMTPAYVKVREDLTVSQTISFIRSHIDDVETIYYIYITDTIGRLQGVVSLRDLFRYKDDVPISEFMQKKIYLVKENTDQRETAQLLRTHDLLALPVVDNFNRLLGIVTVDDAMNVLASEHHEDVLKMNAIAAGDKYTKTYLGSSVSSLFKSRIPWLAILLIAGTLTTNVINVFTDLIQTAAYLVLFIPIVISTGGNTATQSATLIIRALARNEIEFRQLSVVLLKELLVASCIGITLAVLMITRSIILPPVIPILEAAVIGSSLAFIVLFSAFIGAFAPLLISRLGADPTVVTTPLIATLVDLVGLFIYFGMAHMIIR